MDTLSVVVGIGFLLAAAAGIVMRSLRMIRTATRPASHREALLWGLRLGPRPLEQRIAELRLCARRRGVWLAIAFLVATGCGAVLTIVAFPSLSREPAGDIPAWLPAMLAVAFLAASGSLLAAINLLARYRGARLRLALEAE
jgi:hypothetical protein